MDRLCRISLVILCMTGCQVDPSLQDANAHDEQGHHAHDEMEATQISLWNSEVELFIEHTPFIAGKPTRFVTHVTHLDQWSPRIAGEIRLVLSMEGEAPIKIQADAPTRDGIYIPTLTFPKAGKWNIEIQVPLNDGVSSQTISDVMVYASVQAALQQQSDEQDEGISFLKEQQWRMPFASEEVREHAFRASLSANGILTPRAGGEVVIHAPVNGRILASETAFPHMGAQVKKGQKLLSLMPRLDQADDLATLTLAAQKAELAHDFAQQELERLKGLFAKEAIPESRLRVAALEVKNTGADLATAKERLQQFSSVQKETGQAKGRVDLYSPLTGIMIEANVVAGALAAEGDRMFKVVDLSKLWLNIQIPEGDIGRVSHADSAWFTVEGIDGVFEVSHESGGRLVALGGEINPQRRTVPLIFEMPNPKGLLRVGMFVQASVPTGASTHGPSIPFSALVEEGGQSVAYVQTSGESFERRILQLGIQDGNRVQVVSGVVVGERVVTKGAYQIRLAASSTTLPAHGHAH